MTKILITGANGFLGKNLLNFLSSNVNFDVYGIVRKSNNILNINNNIFLLDDNFENLPLIINEICPDIVIHTATYFHAEHKVTDIVPIIQSIHIYGNLLLDALKNSQKKIFFINTGTSWQHFNNSPNYNPVCLHSAHKEAFEKIIEFYSAAYDIKYVTVKLFDTYGPNDERNKIINLLIKGFKQKKPLDLSPGNQLMDIVHINDVCDAYQKIINLIITNQSIEKSYGVSSGEEISLKDIVNIIQQIAGHSIVLNWGARKYRDREVMYNWRNSMLSVPGWLPSIELKDGLKSLYFNVN